MKIFIFFNVLLSMNYLSQADEIFEDDVLGQFYDGAEDIESARDLRDAPSSSISSNEVLRSLRSADPRSGGILRSLRSYDVRNGGILRSLRSINPRNDAILRSLRSEGPRMGGILRSLRYNLNPKVILHYNHTLDHQIKAQGMVGSYDPLDLLQKDLTRPVS